MTPLIEYLSMQQLLAETRRYGVGRSKLYSEHLTPAERKRLGMGYNARGHSRIPAAAAATLIEGLRVAYSDGSLRKSKLAKNLPSLQPCKGKNCKLARPGPGKKRRRITNSPTGLCRWCRAAA